MSKLLAAALFLGMNFYIYNFFATEAVIPPRERFESFPLEIEGWTCAEQSKMEPKVERNLGVSDYLLCDYENPELRTFVGIYVGYHESQVREEGGGAGETSIHPPAHCLPGSGWDIIQNQLVVLDWPELPQRRARVRRLVIAKGEARALVYYWYQSRGRVIAEDWRKIVYVGLDRATRQRTDGSLVRFTAPIMGRDDSMAEAAFRSLAPPLMAELRAYVPE